MLDLRTPARMVARFNMQRTSLYPHICVSRQTYIFTSHADQPLAVWDR